jgi:hypothetical protein
MKKIILIQILTIMAIASCSDSTNDNPADTFEPNDTATDTEGTIPEGMGVVEGVVTDGDGIPVEGVTVTVNGTEAVTDFGGHFSIEADPGDAVVGFTKTGFAESALPIRILKGAATPIQKGLLERREAVEANIDDGATVGDEARVTLTPDTLVTEDGTAATGNVRVSITPIDVTGDLGAAPGDFSASKADGKKTRLETFAMAEYYFEDKDGKPLQVADGKKVTIEMDVPEGLDAKDGDSIPAWYFDSKTGKWQEQGEGKIVENEDGTLKWQVEVEHFSWWNCDKPIEEKDCVSGTITDCNGDPVRGASVRAKGKDYNGESSGFGDADGQYCVDIKRGATAEFVVVGKVNNKTVGKKVTVTGEDAGASCESGGCSTQNIELACDPSESDLNCSDSPLFPCDACLSGRIVDLDGTALKNAVIALEDPASGFRASAISGNDGTFTITAPKNVEVTLTVNAAGFAPYDLSATAGETGQPPDCEDLGDIVVEEKSTDGTVYETCNTSDLSIEATDLDGAPELLGALPHVGMMVVDDESGSDLSLYLWMTDGEDPENTDGSSGFFVPVSIPAASAAGSITEADGLGSTNSGGIIGVNSDLYTLTASSISWNEDITGAGQTLTGDITLEFTTLCGTGVHVIKYAGTFSTVILGLMDYVSQSDCFNFLSLALAGFNFTNIGTITLTVAGETANLTTSQAEYNVGDDQLNVVGYNDIFTFSLTRDAPVFGEQNVSDISYMDSAAGCTYEGYDIPSVTIDDNETSDLTIGPLNGSFSATIPIIQTTDGCPDTVTVSGEMVSAICSQAVK